MARCQMLTEVGRRQFLKGSGVAAAGAVAGTTLGAAGARATPAPARIAYPSSRLADLADLKVNEPLDILYPDQDSPGVLLKLGEPVRRRRRPGWRRRRLLDPLPAQGLPARLRPRRPGLQLPGPLLTLRCRARRAPDLGPGDPEPAAVPAPDRRGRRHPCRRRGRADLRPRQQRALRGSVMAYKRQIDRLPIIPADAKEPTSSATSASSAAATRPTAGTSTGRAAPHPTRTSSGSISASSRAP